MKPTHILNGFFLSLVEQYRKVMHFDKEIKEPLLNKYKHRDTSLRLSVHRLEMHRLEEARKKQQQAVNDDAVAMQTIDWGDFAVVVSACLVVVIRLLATRYCWNLPKATRKSKEIG